MQNSQTTPSRAYIAIFSMAMMTFLGILNETSVNVTYPILSREFNTSLDVTQWITAGYLLTVTIVMGTTAYLLRQFPARRIHLVCVIIFIAGDVTCALAPGWTADPGSGDWFSDTNDVFLDPQIHSTPAISDDDWDWGNGNFLCPGFGTNLWGRDRCQLVVAHDFLAATTFCHY